MKVRILIVEDDPPSMALVKYLLDCAGYGTITAENGRDGVQRALDGSPGLILCDLQLPFLNGFQVLEHLKLRPDWRPIPVIAVTAFSMMGDREAVLAAGFDGYISKPIDPESFVSQVRAFLPNGAGSGV